MRFGDTLQRSAGRHQYAMFYGFILAGVFGMIRAAGRNWKP